jgi:hypothetical protein
MLHYAQILWGITFLHRKFLGSLKQNHHSHQIYLPFETIFSVPNSSCCFSICYRSAKLCFNSISSQIFDSPYPQFQQVYCYVFYTLTSSAISTKKERDFELLTNDNSWSKSFLDLHHATKSTKLNCTFGLIFQHEIVQD